MQSEHVARTTQFQIGLRNLEAIGGAHHRLDAFAPVVGEFKTRHQDAVALVCAAPDASAQLVQLAQSEALGVFDDHIAGVRHVDAHLDHRRSDHDLRFAAHEPLHLVVLVGGFHFAVNDAELVLRLGKFAAQRLVALHQRGEFQFLVLLDERIDDVHLVPLCDFGAHLAEHLLPLVFGVVPGGHGFASRRQFVDHTDVEVAVEGHGERARNGCGGHHQNVRRKGRRFFPERGALLHPEAVLFVDERQSEIFEHHPGFDQRVGADQDIDLAREQVGEEGFAPFALHRTAQKLDADVRSGEVFRNARGVLLRQNFGRSHQARLETVVERDEHTQQPDHGFSAAHVALEQAVHLDPHAQVLPDFAHDPLLRPGEFEGERMPEKLVENGTDSRKGEAAHRILAPFPDLEQAQLQKEQFLELHAPPRRVELRLAAGEVQSTNGGVALRQVEFCEQVVGQVLGQVLRLESAQQFRRQFAPSPGIHALHGQFVGRRIDRCEGRLGLCLGFDLLDVGVGDGEPPVELVDAPVDHVLAPHLQKPLEVGRPLEPHQFDGPGFVAQPGVEPFLTPLAGVGDAAQHTFNLHLAAVGR